MSDEEFERELEEELKASGIITPEVDPSIIDRNPVQATPEQPSVEQPQETYPNVRKLCIISLICYIIPHLIGGIGGSFLSTIINTAHLSDMKDLSSAASGFMIALEGLMGGSYIAAWVLMIIARVNNKRDTFAKVLMIVYIVMAVVAVIAVIVLIILIAALAHAIAESCGSGF